MAGKYGSFGEAISMNRMINSMALIGVLTVTPLIQAYSQCESIHRSAWEAAAGLKDEIEREPVVGGNYVWSKKVFPAEMGPITLLVLGDKVQQWWRLVTPYVQEGKCYYQISRKHGPWNPDGPPSGKKPNRIVLKLPNGNELRVTAAELAHRHFALDEQGLVRTDDRVSPRPDIKETILVIADIKLNGPEKEKLRASMANAQQTMDQSVPSIPKQ